MQIPVELVRQIELLLTRCRSYQFTCDDDTREYLLSRLESARNVAEYVLLHISDSVTTHHTGQYLRELHSRIIRYIESPQILDIATSPSCSEVSVGFASETVFSTHRHVRGRPMKVINLDLVEHLREAGYTWVDIAASLMVSRTTLWRRVSEAGATFGSFTVISDAELDVIVRRYQDAHPHSGQSILLGHLLSIGIRVQRHRVRSSMDRVDPLRKELRWHQTISRRSYSVPGPNSLWHIDGHHSLIRWRFVVHGCTDGYSRYLVYLDAATNNRADTVFGLFRTATFVCGIPSRVRTDKGGENSMVCYFMIATQGTGRGSHIAGSSCHNQRIERTWRDVYRCVCSTYHSVFYTLEAEGVLDPDNDIDLFVLHSVYLPRLRHSLKEFAAAWNMHPMRTERNWSPRKIWFNGVVNPTNSNQRGIANIFDPPLLDQAMSSFGTDPNGPLPADDGVTTVVVPDTACPLSDEQLDEFQSSFDALTPCDDFGVSIFLAAKEKLKELL